MTNKKEKKEVNWSNLTTNSPEFKKAESNNSLSRLFHEYFKASKPSQVLINELAEKNPDLLLNSIRINRAFLNPEHLSSFNFFVNHHNKRLVDHYQFFLKLVQIESEKYFNFNKYLNKIDKSSIIKNLFLVSFWFEEKRAQIFKNNNQSLIRYDIKPYIETIEFYLSHYFFNSKEQLAHKSFKEFQDSVELNDAYQELKKFNNFNVHPVFFTLNLAHDYLTFLKNTIEQYSFDLNFEVDVVENVAQLYYKDEIILKKWFTVDQKLKYWFDFNEIIAKEIIDYKIKENPDFIINKNGIDYEMNYQGAIRHLINELIIEDFYIKDSKLFDVPINELIKVFNGFVSNAWGRFVNPMDKLNCIQPDNWLDNIYENYFNHFKETNNNNKGDFIAALPIKFLHERTLKNIIGDKNFTDNLIRLISLDLNGIDFNNKFKPYLNLIGKPFIKINDFYFCYDSIIGEGSSQTNLLLNIMESNRKAHSSTEKDEVIKMESAIYKKFIEAGFKNSICQIEFKSDTTKGDFDIIVYEKGVLLCIELKRSKLRLHLSEINDEYENSFKKASSQLDKVKSYIKNNYNQFVDQDLKTISIEENEHSKLKIYTLIVSTSFEYDHELIDNKHHKISLFELQNILDSEIEEYNGNKLEGLMQKILRNEYWDSRLRNLNYPDFTKFNLKMPL
jgi:hypothetical protein